MSKKDFSSGDSGEKVKIQEDIKDVVGNNFNTTVTSSIVSLIT